MDKFKMGEIIRELFDNEAYRYNIKVGKVNYDEVDGAVLVEVYDNGKKRIFTVDVKEVK